MRKVEEKLISARPTVENLYPATVDCNIEAVPVHYCHPLGWSLWFRVDQGTDELKSSDLFSSVDASEP